MKLIVQFLKGNTEEKKSRRKTFAENQRDLLVKQGRDQFKRLMDRGLSVPVAYL